MLVYTQKSCWVKLHLHLVEKRRGKDGDCREGHVTIEWANHQKYTSPLYVRHTCTMSSLYDVNDIAK